MLLMLKVARIHPLLLKICEYTYKRIIHSDDQLSSFKEHFDSMPRVVLECSMRDHISPESEVIFLQKRLHSIESEMSNVSISLEQRERDLALLQDQFEHDQRSLHLAECQLRDLLNSRSWQLTRPLRALIDLLRE